MRILGRGTNLSGELIMYYSPTFSVLSRGVEKLATKNKWKNKKNDEEEFLQGKDLNEGRG